MCVRAHERLTSGILMALWQDRAGLQGGTMNDSAGRRVDLFLLLYLGMKDRRTRPPARVIRAFVAYCIGRPLKRYELVHHKDENPWNNRPDNLVVVTRKEHQDAHAILRRRAAYNAARRENES